MGSNPQTRPDANPPSRPEAALSLGELTHLFARARDWESHSEAIYLLGQASYHQGELAAARSYYEHALQQSLKPGSRISRYLSDRIILALAILLGHDEHDFSGSIERLNQLSDDNVDIAASARLEHGYCLMHLGQLRDAEEKVRGGLSMARDLGQRWKIAHGLQYLALVLRQQGDLGSLEEATRHLTEAAKLLSDNPRLLSQIADTLGRVYNQLGKYSRAVRWFDRSLKSKEQLGDRVGMAISYGGIAEALANAGHYEQAIRAYRKDIQLAIETSAENAPILAQLQCQIAECYRRNNELKDAKLELAKAASQLANIPTAQRSISSAFIALYHGRLCLDGGAAEEALQHFSTAEDHYTSSSYSGNMAAVRLGMGTAQLALGNIEDAAAHLQWAEEHESDPRQKQAVLSALADLSSHKQEHEHAALYQARALALNEQYGPRPSTVSTTSPAAKKQYEIELLSGPDEISFAHQVVELHLRVANTAEAESPPRPIEIRTNSLEKQGGRIYPEHQQTLDDRGEAHFELHLGHRPDAVSLEIYLVGTDVLIERHFRVYNIKVDGVNGPEAELFRQMFYGLTRKVSVERNTTFQTSRATYIRATCTLEQSSGRLRRTKPLIKIGTRENIRLERDSYNQHIDTLDATSTAPILAFAMGKESAGLAYVPRSKNQLGDLLSFFQFFQARNLAEIGTAIDALYNKVLSPLHAKVSPAEDVLTPTFRRISSANTDRTWAQLSEALGPDFLHRNETGTVSINLDSKISAPEPFDLYHSNLQRPLSGILAETHGDLRGENIWIDPYLDLHVVDWRGHGLKHIFRDYVSLEIDLRLSVLERFSKQPHFKHWFAAESTFTTIETEISPTATASLANPFSASKDEADLWKKLYQVIGQIRLCALKGTGRKRGPEYAMSLFMSATEEMATQQDPRRQIVLMALSLAFAKDLRPAAIANSPSA